MQNVIYFEAVLEFAALLHFFCFALGAFTLPLNPLLNVFTAALIAAELNVKAVISGFAAISNRQKLIFASGLVLTLIQINPCVQVQRLDESGAFRDITTEH